MAKSSAAVPISLNDVRASVRRVQGEGERLVTRIRGESERVAVTVRQRAEDLVERVRSEARRLIDTPLPGPLDDVRKQVERVRRDLDERRTELVADLRKRADVLAAQITRSLGAAEATRVQAVSRDLTGLELRVAELERHLADVTRQLKEKAKKKERERERETGAIA